jgi:hypothetical protein
MEWGGVGNGMSVRVCGCACALSYAGKQVQTRGPATTDTRAGAEHKHALPERSKVGWNRMKTVKVVK